MCGSYLTKQNTKKDEEILLKNDTGDEAVSGSAVVDAH